MATGVMPTGCGRSPSVNDESMTHSTPVVKVWPTVETGAIPSPGV